MPTVLSVDDHDARRSPRSRTLRDAGFRVVDAAAGADAVQLAIEEKPSLVVLAVSLPGVDGFDVCRRLKADPRTRAIPVLHLSAPGLAEEDIPDALLHPPDACLPEPVHPRTLIATARALIRAHEAEHLQTVLAGIAEGHYVLDAEWRFTEINPAAERHFQRSAAELLGKNIWHATGVSTGPVYDAFHAAASAGSELHFEAESAGNPGVWADLHLYPRAGGLDVYFHDISGRKRAEQALRENECRQRKLCETLLSNSPYCVAVLEGRELRHRLANPAYQTAAGSGVPLVGLTYREVFPDAAAAGVEARLLEVLETGESWSVENYRGPLCGKPDAIWEGHVLPLPATPGEGPSAVVLVREVTERSTLEESLRQRETAFNAFFESSPGILNLDTEEKIRRSEAKYRHLLEMAFEGVWVLDTSSRTTFVNRRMAEMIKYSRPEEIMGRTAFEFVPEEDHDSLRARLSSPASGRYEVRLLCKDGSLVWASISASEIRDENGRLLGQIAVMMDITERKRALQALEESRKRLELALEAAELGTWEVDIETGLVTAGPRTCAMFDLDVAAPRLEDWFSRMHPEDRDRVTGEIQRAVTGPSRYHTEYRVVAEDGSTRWVFAKGVPAVGAQGRAGRLIGVSQDITARKQSEEAANRERDLLQAIVQNIPVMLCLWDPNLRTFQLNRACESTLGWTTAEANAGDFMARIYPDPAYRAAVVEYMQSLAPGWRELNVTARDGSLVPGEWANIRLYGDRMLGIGIDLRARRQAQDALRLSEARERARAAELQAIMDAVPAIIFIARDPACLHITGSRMSYDVLRVSPGRNLSRSAPETEKPTHFRVMADGRELAAHELPIQKAASTGLPVRDIELDIVYEDGASRRWFGNAVPLLGEDGRPHGAVGAFIDITERKRAEERLRQAQKLESIGLLAGGIAHDFNNLLTGILGNASLVLDEAGPRAAERVKDVVSSAERAAHLTRQLLAYSGKGQFVVRDLDISQAINEMSGLLEASVPKSVTLSFALERRLPAVRMDPGQIQQILMNLVINAGEAIGEGKPGRITVSTGTSDWRTPFVDSIGEEIAPGRYVSIEVGDTGSGIDEQTKQKIFDPFFTTKFTGRGLGLAAVAGIVRSRKGAITVRSVQGAGSTFRVLLPVFEGEQQPDADTRGAVLVVDDEPRVRDFLCAVFTREGYRVLLATGGHHALAVSARESGPIDAAVVDVVMPLMDAGDLLDELKACRPQMKILLTSGYSEAEARRLCAAWPGAVFIQKPYTARQVAQALEDLLRG